MFVRLYGSMPMCNLSQTHPIGFSLSLTRCACPCPSHSFMASCKNCLPLPLEDVYHGPTDNALVRYTRPKGHCTDA